MTQYQLFSSVSFSFRMKGSQLDSSPRGMRSGLVRTPGVVGRLGGDGRWGRGGETDRWYDVLLGRVALRAGEHLGSQSRLVQNVSLGCGSKERGNVLSHATVKRIIQLGFLMYDVTRLSTREISFACPWVLLTLAINPIQKKIIIPNSKKKKERKREH